MIHATIRDTPAATALTDHVCGPAEAAQQQQHRLSAATMANCGLLPFRTLDPGRHRPRQSDYDAERGAAVACRWQGVAMPIGAGHAGMSGAGLAGPVLE